MKVKFDFHLILDSKRNNQNMLMNENGIDFSFSLSIPTLPMSLCPKHEGSFIFY